MLNNITWGNYLAVVFLALIIYYAFIGVRFYSREIRALLSKKQPARVPVHTTEDHTEYDQNDTQGEDPFNTRQIF
ncbi:hypothetical protein GCM10023313_06180 [Mucilaginibacter defluvii]|uniref:Cbb3-type cytochrome oxidase component FixQ n=1 Tax=Mucilaginibacter defluvii TaxID=1196019 RepID=A0ABP9FKD6_9SPHI